LGIVPYLMTGRNSKSSILAYFKRT
jgi:hypothetical protein